MVIIAPFLVSLSVNDNMANYKAGYFSDLAEDVAGLWLKECFTVGAVMCMVALYANTIITSEVSVAFFVQENFPSTVVASSRGSLRNWLFYSEPGGAAPIFIIFNGAVAMVLVLLPYKVLIEFTMTLMAPPCLLYLASFIMLRIQVRVPRQTARPQLRSAAHLQLQLCNSAPLQLHSDDSYCNCMHPVALVAPVPSQEPELQRDFAIPGGNGCFGIFICVMMAIPPAALTLLQVGEPTRLRVRCVPPPRVLLQLPPLFCCRRLPHPFDSWRFPVAPQPTAHAASARRPQLYFAFTATESASQGGLVMDHWTVWHPSLLATLLIFVSGTTHSCLSSCLSCSCSRGDSSCSCSLSCTPQ